MQELIIYSNSTILSSVAIILLAPLLSSALSFFFIPGRYAWLSPIASTLLVLISCITTVALTIQVYPNTYIESLEWFTIGNKTIHAGILADSISLPMILIVSIISLLVHIYSIGYMAGDSRLKQYFGMLGFFTFSMMGLSLANNLLLVFFFWELVGFSSYMLIGHWMEKPLAAAAAKKAFLMNRLGDLGFIVGLMIIWAQTGTLDITVLQTTSLSSWNTVASLCLLSGVLGKSAQLPFFNWLPDAMEGPTPISALIHAATMVAAGVFLLARMHWIFSPLSLDITAVVGATTALLGALCAMAQYDIKKILAYSTISQLGIMVMAFGCGSYESATLHLFTHAFFKACLFLAAGSVIHALKLTQHTSQNLFDVQDIRNLGGLRKKLPITFIAFVMAGASLSGLPFFSGSLSKDAILSSVWIWSQQEPWKIMILLIAFLVSFLTVVYMFRLLWFVFLSKSANNYSAVTEPPWIMRFPLIVLAVTSLWLIISWNPFEIHGWQSAPSHNTFIAVISALLSIAALFISWLYFRKREIISTNQIIRNGFYLDSFYIKLWRIISLKLAGISLGFDKKWIDRSLHATAFVQVTIAHLIAWFDRAIIDGTVNGAASTASAVGSITRSFQSGKIQLYIFWALLGIIFFLFFIWI